MSPPLTTQSPGDRFLFLAALALIGDGATPADLAEGFSRLSAVQHRDSAATLLDRLMQLGLVVRVPNGGDARYVPTSLGRRHALAVLTGQPETIAGLEELERLRSDLLSTIAHELRTPLTALRTSAGLLLDPNLAPDPAVREQLLKMIDQSAERMQRLVTDVLDLSRFRAGGLRLQLRRFDARVLAQESADALAPLLQEKGQSLPLAVPPRPVWVYGDHRRLGQALINLLSNAHKYSPSGSALYLTVTEQAADVCWVVTDHGRGIAPEDLGRLFERFFVAAADSSDRSASTGLGLPISLAIAQAHGGTIEVQSAVGRGSTFTLRIPQAGPADEHEP